MKKVRKYRHNVQGPSPCGLIDSIPSSLPIAQSRAVRCGQCYQTLRGPMECWNADCELFMEKVLGDYVFVTGEEASILMKAKAVQEDNER